MMPKPPTFGWCFFKNGMRGHHGKMHYLPENTWTSRCGHWIVRVEERKFIHFVPLSQIRPKKVCRKCVEFLAIDAHYDTILNNLSKISKLNRKYREGMKSQYPTMYNVLFGDGRWIPCPESSNR